MTSSRPTPVRSSRSSAAPGSARALLALLLLAAPLRAHDHWIEPSTFHPAAGERVDLHLCVGHPGASEDQLRDPRHFVRFEAFGALGSQPVLGLDGKAPAGLLRAKQPGAVLVAFQSDHALVELDPSKYAAFLAQEGLADVQAERERRAETALPGRDSYARFDKALVVAGEGGSTAGFDRVVGMPLELVLETDPAAWRPGGALVLRLEFGGEPLADRQIKLVGLAAPHRTVLARTDAAGRARFDPPDAGAWCAFAVHQRRATSEQHLEGDWEGFWASFAFELGSASSAIAQSPGSQR